MLQRVQVLSYIFCFFHLLDFGIDRDSGTITGTVSSVDTQGRQPMRVTVTATNSIGQSATILVPFEFGKEKKEFPTSNPPPQIVFAGEPFEIDLEPYIITPPGIDINEISW